MANHDLLSELTERAFEGRSIQDYIKHAKRLTKKLTNTQKRNVSFFAYLRELQRIDLDDTKRRADALLHQHQP